MNIGIDVDGCITNLENWFYFNNNHLKSKLYFPNDIVYISYVMFSKPRKNAINTINDLYKNNQIFIITARKYGTQNNIKGFISRNILKYWLKKHNIKYNQIIFCSDFDKVDYCKKNNINVMIEDNPDNIVNLKKANINVIPFDTSYNSGFSSWLEICKQIQSIKYN